MEKADLVRIAKRIPDEPGVYFFLGTRKEILYIGKATSLKNRVRSYFSDDIADKRSAVIERMVSEAKTVEWTVTDSVLEALILEANLIRTHKPKYNSREKDDKSFNHLVVTNEEFPRFLVVRGKDIGERFKDEDIRAEFGPFTSGGSLKEALKIIQRIFRFYDTKTPVAAARSKMARGKIAFNRQIGLYPSAENKEEYLKTVRHIELLFEGKKRALIKELGKQMRAHAKKQEFEQAERFKRQMFALEHIQDVALIKEHDRTHRDDRRVRIEAYDIAHTSGMEMVGVMTVVEGGEPQKGEYRKFKIKTVSGSNDPAALAEVLGRRLAHHEWSMPQVIVMDGGVAQLRRAEAVLREAGVHIPVVAVTKDEYHRPKKILGPQSLATRFERDIVLANAEAHRYAIGYHRRKRDRVA